MDLGGSTREAIFSRRTIGVPKSGAPSSPRGCHPTQLRQGFNRPIGPIQTNSGSVFILDPRPLASTTDDLRQRRPPSTADPGMAAPSRQIYNGFETQLQAAARRRSSDPPQIGHGRNPLVENPFQPNHGRAKKSAYTPPSDLPRTAITGKCPNRSSCPVAHVNPSSPRSWRNPPGRAEQCIHQHAPPHEATVWRLSHEHSVNDLHRRWQQACRSGQRSPKSNHDPAMDFEHTSSRTVPIIVD
ncbi:hypothetical protein ACLOJK_035118 [Asimina triloba]